MAERNNSTTQESPEKQPHAGGRPLKFETVEALQMAIQLYFDNQDPHIEKRLTATGLNANGTTMFSEREVMTEQKPYTMSGLARALGVDRKTLLNYSNRDEYFPTVRDAKQRCEEYAEGQLFGPFSSGAKFNLINNYASEARDWTDKQSVDHTTNGKELPTPILGGASQGK